MNNPLENKLVRQLFIGKVVDIIGFEKTQELIKEAASDLAKHPPINIGEIGTATSDRLEEIKDQKSHI